MRLIAGLGDVDGAFAQGPNPWNSHRHLKLLKAHGKAFDEDLAIDEVDQLTVFYKAAELARQAAPDSTLGFDLAIGYIAGVKGPSAPRHSQKPIR